MISGTECQECRKDREKGTFQRHSTEASSPGVAPPIVHEVVDSQGQPLDTNTRSFFESRFRHDFSQVRVHTNARAAESARAVHALAYTVGQNLVFDSGSYAPATAGGQKLIAHELTHVLQQAAMPTGKSDSMSLEINDNRSHEAEAEADAVQFRGPFSLPRQQVAPSSIQRRKPSGLEWWQTRSDPDEEAQRIEAQNIVMSGRSTILEAGKTFKIIPEAIAGAILWEALENPYHRSRGRLGPGKVYPTEMFGKSEAEKVEEEKRVPAAKDVEERTERLKQPAIAVAYIAAIMQRHADNYLKIAGVDIGNNAGVLCTLFQGGHSEERAKKLAEKRKVDPAAQPVPGDEMGPWVEKMLPTLSGLLMPGPRPH